MKYNYNDLKNDDPRKQAFDHYVKICLKLHKKEAKKLLEDVKKNPLHKKRVVKYCSKEFLVALKILSIEEGIFVTKIFRKITFTIPWPRIQEMGWFDLPVVYRIKYKGIIKDYTIVE